jgi:hypothetical protein
MQKDLPHPTSLFCIILRPERAIYSCNNVNILNPSPTTTPWDYFEKRQKYILKLFRVRFEFL